MPIYVLRKLQLVSWNYRVRCKKIYFLHLLSLIGKQSLVLICPTGTRNVSELDDHYLCELFLFAVNVLETGHVSNYCFRKSFSEIRIRQFCTN